MSPLTIYLVTSWILVFLLHVGSCKEKWNLADPTEERSSSDTTNPRYWNPWERESYAEGSWSTVTDHTHVVPLSLKEHGRRVGQSPNHKSKSNKTDSGAEEVSVGDLRKKLLSFGKSVLKFVTGLDSRGGLGLQNFFPDSKSSFSSRQSEGESEGRGVVDWLARLIGVQGKSLGEFLREYQVHVLYDLVFTFFKWVFFLYAGLLIP